MDKDKDIEMKDLTCNKKEKKKMNKKPKNKK